MKHDIWSMAQAVDSVGGHVAVCDVVAVQTQVLQAGKRDEINELAETCHVDLCREGKIEGKLWKLVEKQNSLLNTFWKPYAQG